LVVEVNTKKVEGSGEPNGYPAYARAAGCGMLNGCFMLLFQGEAAFQEYILKLIDATQQQVSLNMCMFDEKRKKPMPSAT
jgi:hypothetical protein